MHSSTQSQITDLCVAEDLTNDQLVGYARDGWLVVRSAVVRQQVETLRQEILAVLASRNMADSYLAQTNEYLAGSLLDGWVNSIRLRRIASQILRGTAHLYLPFTAVKGSGQGEFAFHQDNNYTLLDGPACNCWTAFVPMTADNGCLRVVSGSHLQGTLPSQPNERAPGHRRLSDMPETWTDVHMDPGDICIFDRLTVHASGSNRSGSPRVAYAVQFHHHQTQAYRDGIWQPLLERPAQRTAPVAVLTNERQVEA
jgi:phytanoyl-CoA hydroxylase